MCDTINKTVECLSAFPDSHLPNTLFRRPRSPPTKPRLLIDNNVLTPHHIQVQTQDLEWEKEKQIENRGDVKACVGKIICFFDSSLHSKVLSGVKFQGLRQIFHQSFVILANSIRGECKLQRIDSQTLDDNIYESYYYYYK